MTGDSGSQIQGALALSAANINTALANTALPALLQSAQSILGDLGSPGTEPASVKTAFATARGESDAGFAAAQARSAADIQQQLKQSGGLFSSQAVQEAIRTGAQSIDRAQGQTNSALNFQEATAGLDQTNFLLSSLTRAGGTLGSGALQFGANASNAGQILSAINRENASEGSTYGALAGTIIGAALSAYTGGASIPIGSGIGATIGGWVGGGG